MSSVSAKPANAAEVTSAAKAAGDPPCLAILPTIATIGATNISSSASKPVTPASANAERYSLCGWP